MAVHPLPPGPWLRFVIYQNDENVQWINDVWYKLTASGAPTDWTSLLNSFTSAIVPSLTALQYLLTNVRAIKMYVNNGTFTGSATKYIDAVGLGATDSIPAQVCLGVTLSADIGTRQGQGRLFVSGLDSSDISGDYVSTVGNSNALAFGTAVTSWVGDGDFIASACIWDRKTATLHTIGQHGVAQKLYSRRHRRPRI